MINNNKILLECESKSMSDNPNHSSNLIIINENGQEMIPHSKNNYKSDFMNSSIFNCFIFRL